MVIRLACPVYDGALEVRDVGLPEGPALAVSAARPRDRRTGWASGMALLLLEDVERLYETLGEFLAERGRRTEA